MVIIIIPRHACIPLLAALWQSSHCLFTLVSLHGACGAVAVGEDDVGRAVVVAKMGRGVLRWVGTADFGKGAQV